MREETNTAGRILWLPDEKDETAEGDRDESSLQQRSICRFSAFVDHLRLHWLFLVIVSRRTC